MKYLDRQEAARRSVARQGFTFMRVAGSDPRILDYILRSPNLLGGSVIPSLSRIIEPLTAPQFIKIVHFSPKDEKENGRNICQHRKDQLLLDHATTKRSSETTRRSTESLADTDLTDNLTLRLANIAENKEPINVIKYEADVNNFLPLATPNAELSDPDRTFW